MLQRAQHLSPLETGLAFAPSTMAILVANLIAGRAGARFGPGQTIGLGGLLMATGAATLLFANASTPYGALVAQLIVLGFGLGLIVPVMTAALLGSVDRSHSGVAAGALNTARQTGSVIGVALFGALAAGSRGIVGGLHAALAISVVLALVVVVLSARIGCRVNRRRPAVAPSRVPTRQAADTRARP